MKSHLAGLLLIHTLNGQIIWITCSLLFPPHFLLSTKNILKTQAILLSRQISASSIFWQDGDGGHSPARGDGLLQLPGVQLGNPDCKFFFLITIFIDQSPCSSHSQGKVINCNGSTEFVFATVQPPNQLNLNLIIVTFFLYTLKTLS